MLRNRYWRNWLVRGKQLVTLAVLTTALASDAPASAGLITGGEDSTIFVSNVDEIFVSTVDELYAAVNSDANAGATVVLAPGVYVLSAKDRPNGGRLDLQLDMSLRGVENDRTQVVIDANRRDEFGNRLLPAESFGFTVGRTGIIRTGRGKNTIEWLTIAGNPLAAASISTDLVEAGPPDPITSKPTALPTALRVAHVSAGDSARGVDIRNATSATKGRRIVAEIEDNRFYWGVEGIRVANFVDADDSEISVDMRGNLFDTNRLGCILESNRSSNGTIAVRSYGDVFDDNGLGCMIGGGLVGTTTGAANFNTSRFDAHESQFTNNTRTVFNTEAGGPMFRDTGGILVLGAEVLPSGAPNSTSSNTAIVRLWDCQIAGNHLEGRADFEFKAFGARSELEAGAGLAGTNNHVLAQLRGISALVEVVAVDSEPLDPTGTNTATVVRIPSPKGAHR